MFNELDEVDWASMKHAYGPATDVPDLLRGLLSADAAEREIALDGMYGAVHHQGDVYACTLAAIPFLLEAVADARVHDRGRILGLLASIGGAGGEEDDADDHDEDEEDGEDAEWARNHRMAHEAVSLSKPLFLSLLTDPDTAVRNGAFRALTACREHADEIVPALQHHFAAETDPQNRLDLVDAIGALGKGTAGAWLAAVAAEHADPAVRLAAFVQVARVAPEALPGGIVSTALGLMDETVETAGPPRAPQGLPATPTLVGALREMRENADAGRRAPELQQLIRGLDRALGDRVTDRIEFLSALLQSPDWGRRVDAVWTSAGLLRGWRAPYDDLVRLLGRQLADPETRLSAAAASVITDLFGLAAPAADDLAAYLAGAPRESQGGFGRRSGWISVYPQGPSTLGAPLLALARLGDPRALPMLRWALDRPEPPRDIGAGISGMGEQAAELITSITRRLRDLPRPDGYDERRSGLARVLGGLGALAAPAVPELMDMLRRDQRADAAIGALGRIGPEAAPAVPALRGLLADERAQTKAAQALWEIEGDPDEVLPILRRCITEGGGQGRYAAIALAAMGADGAPAADDLRGLLGDGIQQWTRLDAALALWRTVGDAETALPVMLGLWNANAHSRQHIARAAGEMGAAAQAALPVLRREVASTRRHNHEVHSSHTIHDDELLLRECASALARIAPGDG
ncbi:PBS lyase [Actinomadura rudentiformis]|uniref:PBS lyase n=1 Tax=Actinomadura rudentiformis TaxID=359158 RepID=A0A6H9Z4B5_9ACTN|nr:HEAT repeat domain-containing protein [Actinomadura rudentiformis]KAB2350781.1 PBS lyase [Actinomadura rudentiformis]